MRSVYNDGDIYGKGGQEFPFRLLRVLGWAMLILAMITLMLGVVDIGWSAGNYVGENCNAGNENFDATFLTMPCDDESLVWTWVAAPIWASLFVIITGVIGTRFSTFRMGNLKFHRDIFAIMCVLVCLLWGPVIIIIASLEVVYGEDVFYYISNTNAMEFGDIVKVVVPLLIIVFTFFFWVVAIVGVAVACCCSPVVDDSFEMLAPPPSLRPAPRPMPRPAPQPIMPSYPAYPAYQYPTAAYGYPYYGAYGNYGYGGAGVGAASSMYGGAAQGQQQSGLVNALMPYSGNYGGATYGGYGTRQIAQNPYI